MPPKKSTEGEQVVQAPKEYMTGDKMLILFARVKGKFGLELDRLKARREAIVDTAPKLRDIRDNDMVVVFGYRTIEGFAQNAIWSTKISVCRFENIGSPMLNKIENMAEDRNYKLIGSYKKLAKEDKKAVDDLFKGKLISKEYLDDDGDELSTIQRIQIYCPEKYQKAAKDASNFKNPEIAPFNYLSSDFKLDGSNELPKSDRSLALDNLFELSAPGDAGKAAAAPAKKGAKAGKGGAEGSNKGLGSKARGSSSLPREIDDLTEPQKKKQKVDHGGSAIDTDSDDEPVTSRRKLAGKGKGKAVVVDDE
ncbi:hypothetical protein Rhopal_004083-T1 [Rhodotorula paludigena]|uniref:Uncharacterized protein n=1 Tax=Rhodotorula paludigena TaxID=86838 RepID=A0AAV5GLJ2_9BASI|nr:hypothetical protein Rhopal_004083-T1 [Rhodotorula paludigena]